MACGSSAESDTDNVIGDLFAYGHFFNPEEADAMSAQSHTSSLTLHDRPAISAIKSYQTLFKATLDDLVVKHHLRSESLADGLIGPATLELLTLPRCGVPDYGSEQEANWPNDCRGQLTAGRDFKSLPGMSTADTEKVWHAIANNWTAALSDLSITPVTETDQHKTDFWARLKRLSGGTLAWHELAVSRCDVTLDGAWDNDRTWSLVFAATTGTHEIGHGLGLHHVADGAALMYPLINSHARARRGWPNSSDLKQAQRLGYDVEEGAVQPAGELLFRPRRHAPQPEQPKPPRVTFPDAVKVKLDGRPIEDYFLVPRRHFGV